MLLTTITGRHEPVKRPAAFRDCASIASLNRLGDARGLLGYAYAKAGRREAALAIGTEVHPSSARPSMSGYVRAHYYLGLGNQEQALTELERAYDERSWLVALVKVDPLLDELRAHPRFQALLRRMRFPE